MSSERIRRIVLIVYWFHVIPLLAASVFVLYLGLFQLIAWLCGRS